MNFGNSDLRIGPQRDDRAAADADLEEVRAAGDRDKMRLAIQQLKTATVTQEMPPVTQVMIIGYLIFLLKYHYYLLRLLSIFGYLSNIYGFCLIFIRL